ncbi:MAG: ferredoxin--NADP reductase [Bacteroidota bacterium]
MRPLHPVKVTSNIAIAPNAWLLTFARQFDFTPGHVIGITLEKGVEPRLYSIASGKDHHEVCILYTRKPDGVLTPALSEVSQGDTIHVTDPFGNFICREDRAIWVASGTGIAPFASMFFSGQYHNKTLIQGGRTRDTLYFRHFFAKNMGDHYHPCCSRLASEGCFHGRVTHYLEGLDHVDTDIPYYLCGTAEMVVDVRDVLIARGVPFSNIMAEIFF